MTKQTRLESRLIPSAFRFIRVCFSLLVFWGLSSAPPYAGEPGNENKHLAIAMRSCCTIYTIQFRYDVRDMMAGRASKRILIRNRAHKQARAPTQPNSVFNEYGVDMIGPMSVRYLHYILCQI